MFGCLLDSLVGMCCECTAQYIGIDFSFAGVGKVRFGMVLVQRIAWIAGQYVRMEVPDTLVAVRLIVLASRSAGAARIGHADGIGDGFDVRVDGGEQMLVDAVDIFSMDIWNDDYATWVIDPPFWRYKRRHMVILVNDVRVLFVLVFMAGKPIAERALIVVWLVKHMWLVYYSI